METQNKINELKGGNEKMKENLIEKVSKVGKIATISALCIAGLAAEYVGIEYLNYRRENPTSAVLYANRDFSYMEWREQKIPFMKYLNDKYQ